LHTFVKLPNIPACDLQELSDFVQIWQKVIIMFQARMFALDCQILCQKYVNTLKVEILHLWASHNVLFLQQNCRHFDFVQLCIEIVTT
jgi:hypothetical protein